MDDHNFHWSARSIWKGDRGAGCALLGDHDMKVFLFYEDNENSELHKTLKITLPKSWKDGPTGRLLETFVENYNASDVLGGRNRLDAAQLHLAVRQQGALMPLASDAVIVDAVPDRADVYVCHGPATTLAELKAREERAAEERRAMLRSTVACTHFGCKQRFPPGGPYPACRYHKSPPVFHETAKFWSCCPGKKAYDWETFEAIPGCLTGTCTDVKEPDAPQFLGGSDLRDQAQEAVKLKSIDDFNRAQQGGAPALERLQGVLAELGVEKDLFDQVVAGIEKEVNDTHAGADREQILELTNAAVGEELKESLKAIAAKQLRIK